jgi:hypothetical protein
MSISVEHFRPAPIIVISYLTSDDPLGDQHRAATAIQNYKKRMGGRVIVVWDATLTQQAITVTPALQGEPGVTTIIADDGSHAHTYLDAPTHHVTTREDAINRAYAILRHENHSGGTFFAAR